MAVHAGAELVQVFGVVVVLLVAAGLLAAMKAVSEEAKSDEETNRFGHPFCDHEWELIEEPAAMGDYRCIKCGEASSLTREGLLDEDDFEPDE